MQNQHQDQQQTKKQQQTRLPSNFVFRAYEPLDPNIPSTSSSEPPNFVKTALALFPTFEKDIPTAEKQPVKNATEAAKILAQGRAEHRHLTDLEQTIRDQTEVAEKKTKEAIDVLSRKK